MRLAPAGVIRTGGPDPRGFLVRLGAPARAQTWSFQCTEASFTSVVTFLLHSVFSIVIIERCNLLHRQEKFSHLVRVHSVTVNKRSLPPAARPHRAPGRALCDASHALV